MPTNPSGDYHDPDAWIKHAESDLAYARANQTRCVSIRSFYEGERFFVLVNVHGRAGKKYVYCELHQSARDPWYHQTSRPYSKMVYHAWGVVGNPKCEYVEEQR